jgi:CDP-diacylglycerol--serine O-phosphatidyltransferase
VRESHCCRQRALAQYARFNVTAEQRAGEDGKVRYSEGTPIQTSLLLVMVLAVEAWHGQGGTELWGGTVMVGPWLLHPRVLLFAASGSLMISAIRIPKP